MSLRHAAVGEGAIWPSEVLAVYSQSNLPIAESRVDTMTRPNWFSFRDSIYFSITFPFGGCKVFWLFALIQIWLYFFGFIKNKTTWSIKWPKIEMGKRRSSLKKWRLYVSEAPFSSCGVSSASAFPFTLSFRICTPAKKTSLVTD